MKKKVLALLLAGVMVCSTAACGGDASAEKPSAETEQTSKEEADTEEEAPEAESETPEEDAAVAPEAESETPEEDAAVDTEAESAGAAEEFTLLDVSSDMVDAGLYAEDENGNELVLTLFTLPTGEAMCSLFVFDASGAGDVICGEYTAETETDEENISWSVLNFTDVYTGTDMSVGCAEGDDGTCYIYNETGEVYTAEYLDADSVIDYMGAAVALLSEQ